MSLNLFSFRYTCVEFEYFIGDNLLTWNTSVSDRCCQSCEGVVYKAGSVIDTINHEDDCKTVETSVCRILPGNKKEWQSLNFKLPFPKNMIKLLLKMNLTTKTVVMMDKVTWLNTFRICTLFGSDRSSRSHNLRSSVRPSVTFKLV